jgi:Protein of unknown function (DUF4235)
VGDRILSEERKWALVAAGSAALVGLVSRQLLRRGWSAWRKEPPPDNPAAPEVKWRDALIWAAATGLVVGVGRVVARRGAAAGWKKVTGRMPPV